MSTPYDQIVGVVDSLRKKATSAEEIESRLAQVETDLLRSSAQLERLEMTGDPAILREASLRAVAMFREAVEHIRTYAREHSESQADSALLLARQALAVIVRVKHDTQKGISQLLRVQKAAEETATGAAEEVSSPTEASPTEAS